MKRYLSITRGAFLTGTTYIYGIFFTFVGNLAYIVVIYYLWQQIFDSSQTLRGMSFNQVFVYLALASSVFNLFKTWTDWQISFTIREGTIAVDLIRPLDYQLRMFADALGQMLVNALVITLPSLVMIFGVFGAEIPTGTNLLFFPFSITLAYILSFAFDYIVGLTTFYTESLWGIATSKDIVVTLLSGGLIPLQFFPDSGRRILELLPFQAIYHTPLQIATDPNLSTGDYIALVTVQAFWGLVLIGLSRLFYMQASKVLTINGG